MAQRGARSLRGLVCAAMTSLGLVLLGACHRHVAAADGEPTDPTDSGIEEICALPLASGGLDEDCNGTAASTVPMASARRLEVHGLAFAGLGTSVACSASPVGAFESAVAAGGPADAYQGGGGGWVGLVDGARGGVVALADADVMIAGDPGENDGLGYRVVFRGTWTATGTASCS